MSDSGLYTLALDLNNLSCWSCNFKFHLTSDRLSKAKSTIAFLQEIRSCLPTLLILLFTLAVALTVIPYAFATVFRQMEAAARLANTRLPATNSSSPLGLTASPALL